MREVAGAYQSDEGEVRNRWCEGETEQAEHVIIGKSRVVVPDLLYPVTFSCCTEGAATRFNVTIRRGRGEKGAIEKGKLKG